jgi:hypothetical protein
MSTFKKSIPLSALITALCFISAGALAKDEATETSGFLGPEIYAKLEEVKTRDGKKVKRWIGPSLSFANYQKVMVDEVVLYPKPEPGPQVSLETLEAIQKYTTHNLRERVGKVLNVAYEPGPGVVRIQMAITGVEVKTEGMKAYEVLPVAAIFGAAKAASGTRAMDVVAFIEAKITDSESGEIVGAALRRLEGEELEGKKDQLKLQDMQKNLDTAIGEASSTLDAAMEE